MNYHDKMVFHIGQAEAANTRVEAIEEVAGWEVERRHGRRIKAQRTPQERENTRAYYLKEVLKENIWYGKATGTRSFHMAMAQMYGTAALVQASTNA